MVTIGRTDTKTIQITEDQKGEGETALTAAWAGDSMDARREVVACEEGEEIAHVYLNVILLRRSSPVKVKPSRAKPSQAKPSQAKPSQAKPTQAKPSQAKPSQAMQRCNTDWVWRAQGINRTF